MAVCHNKQYENYYCRLCRDRGEFAVRVAGSGASEGACCDVVRISNGKTYLAEIKATRDAVFKPNSKVVEQLQDLRQTALKIRAVPVLVIRFKNRNWAEIDLTGNVPKYVSVT